MSGGAIDTSFGGVLVFNTVKVKVLFVDVSGCSSLALSVIV
jgi:hypothetical protein